VTLADADPLATAKHTTAAGAQADAVELPGGQGPSAAAEALLPLLAPPLEAAGASAFSADKNDDSQGVNHVANIHNSSEDADGGNVGANAGSNCCTGAGDVVLFSYRVFLQP
jgi:hypothetical protein